MTISQEQAAGYRRSIFTVMADDQEYRISANEDQPAFGAYLRDCGVTSVSIMTAFNPDGEPQPPERNRQDQRALKNDAGKSFDYLSASARVPEGSGPAEECIAILGITLEEARAFGQRYEQDAVLFYRTGEGARLIASDPADQPALENPS